LSPRPKELNDRECAIWAAWANGYGIDVPSCRDFIEALIDKLAEGQERGDYDIAGFCVLNEPNTKWPGEPNWRALEMPIGPGKTVVENTAGYCNDMCNLVKGHIEANHRDALGDTVTVVNLYSYRDHWIDDDWRLVAENPNLDVLGIDVYWDQLWGLYARGVPEEMRRVSEEHGKDWWLVETAGADGPGQLTKNPSCRRMREHMAECGKNGARVLGFYRLWGDYRGELAYGSAYNVFTEPGTRPSPRTDCRGERYWECIRDL
jgi:hypothetical protein